MLNRFKTDYPYNICMTSAEELNHTDVRWADLFVVNANAVNWT